MEHWDYIVDNAAVKIFQYDAVYYLNSVPRSFFVGTKGENDKYYQEHYNTQSQNMTVNLDNGELYETITVPFR